jgi:hypothetical protein
VIPEYSMIMMEVMYSVYEVLAADDHWPWNSPWDSGKVTWMRWSAFSLLSAISIRPRMRRSNPSNPKSQVFCLFKAFQNI